MKKARIKKQKDKKVEKSSVNRFSFKTIFITVIIMLLVLIGFYYLTEELLKKNKDKINDANEVVNVRETNTIDYEGINDIESESYYLLLSKDDDDQNNSYDLYINSLKYNQFPKDFYYINLSDDKNKDLLNDNEDLSSIDKLKVKDTTLIYVEDNKIKESYVGSEEILNYLTTFFSTADKSNEQTDSSNKETEADSNKSSNDSASNENN